MDYRYQVTKGITIGFDTVKWRPVNGTQERGIWEATHPSSSSNSNALIPAISASVKIRSPQMAFRRVSKSGFFTLPEGLRFTPVSQAIGLPLR